MKRLTLLILAGAIARTVMALPPLERGRSGYDDMRADKIRLERESRRVEAIGESIRRRAARDEILFNNRRRPVDGAAPRPSLGRGEFELSGHLIDENGAYVFFTFFKTEDGSPIRVFRTNRLDARPEWITFSQADKDQAYYFVTVARHPVHASVTRGLLAGHPKFSPSIVYDELRDNQSFLFHKFNPSTGELFNVTNPAFDRNSYLFRFVPTVDGKAFYLQHKNGGFLGVHSVTDSVSRGAVVSLTEGGEIGASEERSFRFRLRLPDGTGYP